MGNVTQETCDNKNTKVHERIDDLSDKVNKIIGGIIVISVMSAMIIGTVTYHINYRFSSVEKTLDKIEKKIEPKRP